VYIEFNSQSPFGLIMLAVNSQTGDAMSVQLIDGLLVFDRRCDVGRAHESVNLHGKRVTDIWHAVSDTISD
jgi:hypothetical protein